MSTVLEQNANYDAVLRFKQLLLIRLSHSGALMERALDFLRPGEGAHLLMQLEAIVIGLRHLADAAPVVRQLMTLDDMRAFDVDFDREFRQLALALLNGMNRGIFPIIRGNCLNSRVALHSGLTTGSRDEAPHFSGR